MLQNGLSFAHVWPHWNTRFCVRWTNCYWTIDDKGEDPLQIERFSLSLRNRWSQSMFKSIEKHVCGSITGRHNRIHSITHKATTRMERIYCHGIVFLTNLFVARILRSWVRSSLLSPASLASKQQHTKPQFCYLVRAFGRACVCNFSLPLHISVVFSQIPLRMQSNMHSISLCSFGKKRTPHEGIRLPFSIPFYYELIYANRLRSQTACLVSGQQIGTSAKNLFAKHMQLA